MTPKAAILTIGTEVSTGQITNTNASWLAERLTELDWEVILHGTVADELGAMLSLFDFGASQAETLIVTGGLGPTSDDITREVIAKWCGQPLIFSQSSWDDIIKRLSHVGVPIADSNRRQCFFPENAEILTNRNGTAHAFKVQKGTTTIYCLPGPPSEIRGIWKDHLAAPLSAPRGHAEAKRLLRWQTLGLSESRLGELVEAAIAGSGMVSGYRPHLPYVEIKIWCHERDWLKNQPYLEALTAVLLPWTMGRDEVDLGRELIRAVPSGHTLNVLDLCTNGSLGRRLSDALSREGRDLELNLRSGKASPAWTAMVAAENGVLLQLSPWDERGQWQASLRRGEQEIQQNFQSPYKISPAISERLRNYVVETTLAFWLRAIAGLR